MAQDKDDFRALVARTAQEILQRETEADEAARADLLAHGRGVVAGALARAEAGVDDALVEAAGRASVLLHSRRRRVVLAALRHGPVAAAYLARVVDSTPNDLCALLRPLIAAGLVVPGASPPRGSGKGRTRRYWALGTERLAELRDALAAFLAPAPATEESDRG